MAAPSIIIKRSLFVAMLLFLFVPLLQNTFNIKKYIKPLRGAYIEQKDTSLNSKAWFEESYQEQKNKYLNQHFGLRNYYVFLNNQIDYSFFTKINAEHVIPGKAGVLFEDSYINAYYGKNFVGKNILETNINKLKQAQDILKNNGIDLEVIFTPGKASFFSEYIPDNFKTDKKISNYDFMKVYAQKAKLDFIDFNAWFLKLKDKSFYDLFPTGGIHWSNYGSMLAIDSLRKHIESRTQLTMRKFLITDVSFSTNLVDPDNDIDDALNLLADLEQLSMPYAEYKWQDNGMEIRPKALFIGDSYYWNWYYQGFINNMFTDAKFWYYNQTVYPETEKERDVQKLSYTDELVKNQVIVLMATESNIQDIGWGFTDKVINSLKDSKASLSRENTPRRVIYINYLRTAIVNTPDWFEKVKLKAKEKNISVDEMILKDADYIYETEYNKPEVIEYTEQTKARMQKDGNWMKDIKRKAKEKNITVEEMLELDAKYIYDTEVLKKKK